MNASSISVIIPVYNGAITLADTLRALKQSATQPGEIIVVDDGSTDGSAQLAESFNVTVLSTSGRLGPAAARGLGAAQAAGEVLMFLDADVRVHPGGEGDPGTVARIARVFEERSDIDAVFGSYDTHPSARNFVSQWKNLSHHFFHQHGRAEAQTFWAGCSGIRKSVFLAAGGYDARYRGATIEDIELGYRLHRLGFRVLLDPAILCTHSKHWTAWGALKTDLLYRGIPWSRLILRTGIIPDDLNVSIRQRISTAVAWLMVLAFALAAVRLPVASLVGMLLFVLMLLHAWWMEPPADGARVVRWMGPMAAVFSALALAAANGLALFTLCLAAGIVLAAVFRRHPENRRSHWEDLFYSGYFGMLLAALILDLPHDFEILAAAVLALVLVALNESYYRFFVKERGVAFFMAVLPFQFLYHFMNGVSLLAGMVLSIQENPGALFHRRPRPQAAARGVESPLNR